MKQIREERLRGSRFRSGLLSQLRPRRRSLEAQHAVRDIAGQRPYKRPPAGLSLPCKLKSCRGMFQVPPSFKRPLLSALLSGSRIMGCGQSASEELDTSHSFLPKPINLAFAAHWRSCLGQTVCSFFFFYCTFPSFLWLRSLLCHTHIITHADTHIHCVFDFQ